MVSLINKLLAVINSFLDIDSTGFFKVCHRVFFTIIQHFYSSKAVFRNGGFATPQCSVPQTFLTRDTLDDLSNLSRAFETPPSPEIDKSGAIIEYFRNPATPKKNRSPFCGALPQGVAFNTQQTLQIYQFQLEWVSQKLVERVKDAARQKI